jgi:hypothetical protein
MPKFKHYDYNQTAMVVINYQDQLQPGTFEHALHYLISEKLDISAFHQPYKNDSEGPGLRSGHSSQDHPVCLFQRHHVQP